MTTAWQVGQHVRFIGRYAIPSSAESALFPEVEVGARGVVVKVKPDAIWVQVPGVEGPVTLWFEGAFPDQFAHTSLVVLEP